MKGVGLSFLGRTLTVRSGPKGSSTQTTPNFAFTQTTPNINMVRWSLVLLATIPRPWPLVTTPLVFLGPQRFLWFCNFRVSLLWISGVLILATLQMTPASFNVNSCHQYPSPAIWNCLSPLSHFLRNYDRCYPQNFGSGF